jgi:hypothetical protein
VPVVRVERGGVYPDEDVVGADVGHIGVHETQYVRRSEPFLDDRLHRAPCVVAVSNGSLRGF